MPLIIIFLLFQQTLFAQNQAPFISFMGEDCHWGLLDNKKNELLASQYTEINFLEVGDNWLITAHKKGVENYFLYQNDKAIPLSYPIVEKINDRLLKVGQQAAFGLINTQGKGLLLMNNDNIRTANATSAFVQQKGLWGAVDLDGNLIIKKEYKQLFAWEMGGFWGLKNQFQLFDLQGEPIQNALYDSIKIATIPLSVCAVKSYKKWGLINSKNEVQTPFEYLDINLFESGIIAVLDTANQWHLLNLQGEKITKNSFDSVKDLNGKALLVSKNGQQSLLDNNGVVLLEPSLAIINYLDKNWFSVLQDNKIRIYNLNKKQFLNNEFEAIKFDPASKDWTGVLFQQNKKWGWISFDEQILIEANFTQVAIYHQYILITSEENQVGLLSTKGQLILPMSYKVISPKQAFFKVKKEGGDWFFVDEDNNKLNCIIY